MAKEQVLSVRFEKFVLKTKFCWVWKSTKDKDGYGKFWVNGKGQMRAHRVSWFLEKGAWPGQDKFICHKCDNPSCVRPAHLFLGTVVENNRDAVKKKRHKESRKTHCLRGHKFSLENTYAWNKQRHCKRCRKISQLKRVKKCQQ